MSELLNENIYGHAKRLNWIIDYISKEEFVVELGCGTGYMISLPLSKIGYSVYGIDVDKNSIAFGRQIFQQEGLDPGNLKVMDISELDFMPDVIVASEVLEHIQDRDLGKVLSTIRERLKPGGSLLVTVPNGFGWFEMESFVWFRTGIGRFLQRLKIAGLISRLKCLVFGRDLEAFYPSTLSNSHHLQRFTYHSIRKLLENNGFELMESTGSVFFAGPFSNLFFTGIKPIMKVNCILGQWLPRFASGFYISCRAPSKNGVVKRGIDGGFKNHNS